MDGSKLNQQATNTYCQSFSSKIIEDFFSQNEVISGQQIISVTPIKQVNFFILKVLFDEWQEEIKKFKSPYFNYKNEDVNHALKTLVNTLSKNIQIKKEHFQPLLESAVRATLELMYDPANYYLHELSKSNSGDKARELKASSKYIKLYKPIAEKIIDGLSEGKDLSSVIPAVVSDYDDSNNELTSTEELFDQILKLNVSEKAEVVDDIPMPQPLEALDDMTPTETFSESDDLNNQFDPVDEDIENASENNVNQQYTEDVKTLNQSYQKKEEAKSLAAVHETQSLSDLKNNININQRYMFVNDLFDGNESDYEMAMDEVENCDSFDSSVELLVQNYAKKYDWDMNTDEVKELLKVIFKRFR